MSMDTILHYVHVVEGYVMRGQGWTPPYTVQFPCGLLNAHALSHVTCRGMVLDRVGSDMRARITTSSVYLAWTLSRDRNDMSSLVVIRARMSDLLWVLDCSVGAPLTRARRPE